MPFERSGEEAVAMAGFSRRKALSSLAATVGAAAAGVVHLSGDGTAAAAGEMPVMAGMDHDSGHSGHAGFARGGAVDNAANGFDPSVIVRDFDGGEVSQLPDGRTLREWDLVRGRQVDRDRARRALRGLDVQRPRARADAALHRGRPAAHPLHERQRAPAHDPLPRHPPLVDGRRAGARRGDRRRPDRARASRSRTSSTPSRSGCTSTTATPIRSRRTSPRASTARSSSIRRSRAPRRTSS